MSTRKVAPDGRVADMHDAGARHTDAQDPGARRAGARGTRGVWASDTWVRPYLRRYRKTLLTALGLGALALVFSAGLMFFSGYLIDASAERPFSIFEIMVPLGLVQLFGVGRPFLNYLERLFSHDWVLRMTSDLRLRLYRHIESDALAWSARQRTGDVLGLLSEDIGHIQNLYLRTIFPTVVAWAGWLSVSAVMGVLTLRYALFSLVGMGVLVTLVPLVSVLVNGARQEREKQLADREYALLTDDVLGAADWALSGRSKERAAQARERFDQIAALRSRRERFSRVRDLAVQLAFGGLILATFCQATGVLGGTSPDLSGATNFAARPADWIAAFVLGLFPLVDAFVPLSDAAVEARAHTDSVRRLNELDDTSGKGGKTAADEEGARAASPVPAHPDLEVDGLSFTYPGAARQVIGRVTLHIPHGQRVALLGTSGSGKSTLLSLIRGDLPPTVGTVELGGVPTRALGSAAPRAFGVVQQDTYLFHATLLDNLRIADPEATPEQAWEALERVGLGPMAHALPRGLDTMVDEGGMRFSGGERHRVALARILLQNAPVVLLDEPFAALDPLTESDLVDTLLDALSGRTLVLVTHHLLGVSRMDRVVFLEHGSVLLDGSPQELERASERYRRLLEFDRG